MNSKRKPNTAKQRKKGQRSFWSYAETSWSWVYKLFVNRISFFSFNLNFKEDRDHKRKKIMSAKVDSVFRTRSLGTAASGIYFILFSEVVSQRYVHFRYFLIRHLGLAHPKSVIVKIIEACPTMTPTTFNIYFNFGSKTTITWN